jgi:hypothetical protein
LIARAKPSLRTTLSKSSTEPTKFVAEFPNASVLAQGLSSFANNEITIANKMYYSRKQFAELQTNFRKGLLANKFRNLFKKNAHLQTSLNRKHVKCKFSFLDLDLGEFVYKEKKERKCPEHFLTIKLDFFGF